MKEDPEELINDVLEYRKNFNLEEDDESDYEGKMMYLSHPLKRFLDRWLKYLEAVEPTVEDAEKREIYDAIIITMVENKEDFIENVEEVSMEK